MGFVIFVVRVWYDVFVFCCFSVLDWGRCFPVCVMYLSMLCVCVVVCLRVASFSDFLFCCWVCRCLLLVVFVRLRVFVCLRVFACVLLRFCFLGSVLFVVLLLIMLVRCLYVVVSFCFVAVVVCCVSAVRVYACLVCSLLLWCVLLLW